MRAGNRLAAASCLVAGVLIVGLSLCSLARAQGREPVRFRQHLPMYIATDYSSSESWDQANAPYLKAQASMAASVLKHPVVIGGVSMDPYLAFTWRAINWPVGAESSPINESNYLPEAFVRVNEDATGLFRGGRIGWLHNSTGTDSMSASIDRVLLESKFSHELPFNGKTLFLTGYVRGWYVLSTGMGTEGIKEYIDFALWEDAGGELMAVAEIPGAIRVVVNLGLSYQDYEVYIPLAEAYDISLFGQMHNGNANGIVNYEDRATSGGVGLALVR